MRPDAVPAMPSHALGELLDHAPCGFASFADDGTITAANATLAAMLGYARHDLQGARLEKILAVGSRIFYQTHFFPLVRLHGRAEEIFLLLRAADGSDVGVLANVARRERGGAFANDCVFVRVAERRRFEDELLRARREADEARGRAEAHARELVEANHLLEEQAVELEIQQEQMREQAGMMERQAAELQAANAALVERGDELERQRAAADEANHAKSSFLAVMSHELRTPLNAISGYVQLLEMGIYGPVTDAQRATLERIGRSQAHLLRLINDVLNLARIEAGRVEFLVERVELAGALGGVLPMVEPQMAAKGLALSIDVPPGLEARADADKVQQIIINLLGNAVKFTPPGGRVALEGVRDGGRVMLRVSDTGIGIPSEKQAEVFEPFVQVDMSRTRGAEGSGLGLTISRDLARGMGGELGVRSEPGKGSVFTLWLPAAE